MPGRPLGRLGEFLTVRGTVLPANQWTDVRPSRAHGASYFGESVHSLRRPAVWFRTATSERSLSRYCSLRDDSGLHPVWFAVRRPLLTIAALAATARLPLHLAELSASSEAAAIREALTRPLAWRIPVGVTGMAVLEVPADPVEYDQGPHRKTLRRMARRARHQGVTFRPVDDRAERDSLLELAWHTETRHADSRYRRDAPDLAGLQDCELWLAAFASDGRPLLLAITPTDSQWALLRYFRTLGRGKEFSDSRYLMSGALVHELSRRGVRYLVDGRHPLGLPNGLRQFQRLVGFRLARIKVQ